MTVSELLNDPYFIAEMRAKMPTVAQHKAHRRLQGANLAYWPIPFRNKWATARWQESHVQLS